jgi:ribosomal-protein-alanine N-acetyltransferase
MTPADVPSVVAIERRSFARPWTPTSFARELGLAWSTAEVVEETRLAGPRVIGYVVSWSVADEMHLMNVAVHPGRRRRGVGRRLVDRVLAEARARRARVVVLEVRSGNAGARRLYAHVGFRQVGLRRSYYGPGQDALILQCVLGPAS